MMNNFSARSHGQVIESSQSCRGKDLHGAGAQQTDQSSDRRVEEVSYKESYFHHIVIHLNPFPSFLQQSHLPQSCQVGQRAEQAEEGARRAAAGSATYQLLEHTLALNRGGKLLLLFVFLRYFVHIEMILFTFWNKNSLLPLQRGAINQ